MKKPVLPNPTETGLKLNEHINALIQEYEELIEKLERAISNLRGNSDTTFHRMRIDKLRKTLWTKIRDLKID